MVNNYSNIFLFCTSLIVGRAIASEAPNISESSKMAIERQFDARKAVDAQRSATNRSPTSSEVLSAMNKLDACLGAQTENAGPESEDALSRCSPERERFRQLANPDLYNAVVERVETAITQGTQNLDGN